MRLAAVLALLVLPLAAIAQVYTWRDANGKIHYSDQPPADRGAQSRRLAPSADSDDVAAAPKAASDRRAESDKQAADAKAKQAEADRNRIEDAQRQEACERSRTNLYGIQSGQIRFRMTPSGEREALDGSVRDAELAEAQRAVDINCAPRPATPKK